MIDHVYISVSNMSRSLAFYAAALDPLGWRELGSYDSASGPEGVPDLRGLGDAVYGTGTAVLVRASGFASVSRARLGSTSVSSLMIGPPSMPPTRPR